jgi:PAS domain S-box-containing protein
MDQRFAEDRMVKNKIRSIACLPALSQGEVRAMLYLENSQTADIFTLENVGVLKHLSAQFAISVENAFLYDNLNQLVEERTTQLQQEVAEHKSTERELQAQINLFDTLLASTRDTIEVFDPDTLAYIKWNQACIEVTGYSDEEFATMNPATSFFDEADARRVEAGVDQVMQEGHTIVAADVIAKDGRRTPMEFLGTLARDTEGNPLYFISIGRDITERKKAAEALQASEEKYRDLVEKVSDVIYTVDAQGILTFASTAIKSLLGISADEAVGKHFAEFFLPEDLELINQNFVKLISGIVLGPKEYRILTASGETRWIGLSSQPIVKDGQVTGLQGVLTDITERKFEEAQLEEVTIAAERQRLARELHDSVTQTLYSIDLFSRATQSAIEAEKIDTARKYSHQVINLSQSALSDMRLLIFELRPPVLEEVGLAGALQVRLEKVEERAGLKTKFELKGERLLARSVETELYAVALEALYNTLKHAQAEQVTVKLEHDEQHTYLTISDDGMGFDPQLVEKSGGYGLSNMRARVERINGSIIIETFPGRGTTVSVEVAA